jgi:peptide/nickel transport system permease protein
MSSGVDVRRPGIFSTTLLASRLRTPRQPVLAIGGGVLGVIALACLLAPLIAPHSPTAQDPTNIFASPGAGGLFGTDELGRDLFSRFLYAGRISLMIGAASSLIATSVGCLWGLTAAIRRGWGEELLMRSADVAMAIPQMLLALIAVAAFGASEIGLIVIIGLLLAPPSARLVRGVALTEVTQDYYAAAIAYGASKPRLLFRELLPNLKRPLALQASLCAAEAILLEASLSFIGLGIQPPQASWGTLLQQGYGYLYQSTWYILFPALGILVTIWMLNLVADQFRGEGG